MPIGECFDEHAPRRHTVSCSPVGCNQGFSHPLRSRCRQGEGSLATPRFVLFKGVAARPPLGGSAQGLRHRFTPIASGDVGRAEVERGLSIARGKVVDGAGMTLPAGRRTPLAAFFSRGIIGLP